MLKRNSFLSHSFSLFSDVTFHFYSIFVTYLYILNNILILLILGLLVLDIIYYIPILVDENVPQLSYLISPVSHIYLRSSLVTYATLNKILILLVTLEYLGTILFIYITDNLIWVPIFLVLLSISSSQFL